MSRITIEVEGLEQVAQQLRRFGAEAEKGVSDAVKATALQVNRDVKKAIQSGPKTGITYHRIPGPDGLMRVYAGNPDAFGPAKMVAIFRTGGKANLSRTHTASSPGQAPATDTGALASSIYFEQATKLSATVGSRLPYAYYLEFGTSKISPRPAWQPASEKGQVDLTRRVTKALEKAAK